MHLNEIARELRVTTQELRREIAKTNFGISPTAHEVDDSLAKGVVRFLKGKIKPTLINRRVAVIRKDGTEIKESTQSKKTNTDDAEQRTRDESQTPEEDGNEEKTKKQKPRGIIIVRKGNNNQKVVKKPENYNNRDNKVSDRSRVPKNAPHAKTDKGAAVSVSRRIEIEKGSKDSKDKPTTQEKLPRNYYKAGKKKKRSRHHTQEDRILETMQRHPGRKIKIAKVSYESEDIDELSAEEIAVEREDDREHFRAQKKSRAVSQKRGHKAQPQIKAKTGIIEVPSVISVKEYSEKCGIAVSEVIAALLKNGIIATINQKFDYDTSEIIATDLGVKVKKIEEDAATEDLLKGDMKKLLHDEKRKLKPRPPIISIMGHVDHGKTKLLDYIRKTNVVDTEAGGITQHIGAYQVEKKGHLITFLDTPGHEAFTSMRARGAKATDIAILVVAADEGVKPQTVEAINHAKEAGIPIIVAISKIDKQNINIDKIKGELAEHDLQPEDWGGKTIMAPVSAITGEGIDNLLDMILLTAEMEELKANPKRLAVGTVVESNLDKALGPVATVLINTGTLKVGDTIVVGTSLGRIKLMQDHTGKKVNKAMPSSAVRISGINKVPHAGDILQVFKEDKTAKAKVEELKNLIQEKDEKVGGSMVERIVSQISSGEMKFLKIVLKADTKGSLEAIMQALHKIKSDDVAVKIIHFGVGNISDTDVIMASASQALLVGFHVNANIHVKKIAEKEDVDIKNYTIIYKLIEDTKAILSGMMEPEINIIELGSIKIKEIFLNKKTWIIAGGKVVSGKAESKSIVRVKRGEEFLFETELESLKHVKEDVTELEKGSECGIKIKTPVPVQSGDILEIFKVEKIERKLD